MKVIREGGMHRHIECPNCQSILDYTHRDVVVDYPTTAEIDMFGEEAALAEPLRYIMCPVCGNRINVKKEES